MKNKCCLSAFFAVVIALLVFGSFWGYGLADWGLLSWLGAVIIIVAVLVCVICKRADRQE
ncbi:MAG: hypothetical protein ABFS18_01120 [Thermodesulfobacteriota bacterium]